MEPGAGVGPVPMEGAGGNAGEGGDFFPGETSEVLEFDELGAVGIDLGEFFEGFADGDDFVVGDGGLDAGDALVDLDVIATAFLGVAGTGAFDEDAAHRFGGGTEEVAAVVPELSGLGFGVVEAEPGFVDEGGGADGLGGFVGGLVLGDAAQLVVDQRDEIGGVAGGVAGGCGWGIDGCD